MFLQENKGLRYLDLSWNGFYLKGCQHLGDALLVNSDLTELNLNCNRINKDCLEKLLRGFKQNSTLRTLRVRQANIKGLNGRGHFEIILISLRRRVLYTDIENDVQIKRICKKIVCSLIKNHYLKFKFDLMSNLLVDQLASCPLTDPSVRP